MLNAVATPLKKRQTARAPSDTPRTMPALSKLTFTPNPGALGAKKFVPSALAANAPLVVVLHGCTQTPEGYDRGAAWTTLAERHGFAVLYPEQLRANNPNGCFNWFEPGDMRRGDGEPASIKSMIDQLVADHAIDPARIYITGLSAGAAMAGVMLATYPEVFAGGGLIAGLPYGVAQSMPAAFGLMRGRGQAQPTAAQLAALVRGASDHDGRWPTISVWHGSADTVVDAVNADATVAQWRQIHGLGETTTVEELSAGHAHRIWHDASGGIAVEEYVIAGMGHGTPLDAGNRANSEKAGAFLLDVGLSSTLCLATSWGLTATSKEPAERADPVVAGRLHREPARPVMPPPLPGGTNVQAIIENALRAAGLMR